jgi:hypothetical protein
MPQTPASVHPLVDLEARQDDVLQQLEELERRVEAALADFALLSQQPGKPSRIDFPAQAA